MAEKHALISDPAAMYAQAALKDTKDVSKDLMAGDFERQYGTVDKSEKRRHTVVVTLVVTLGALVLLLLVLAMVREVQLSRLQRDVDDLSVTMIAMGATVKGLSLKIDTNVQGDFKTDDAIYTDAEQEISSPEKSEPSDDSLDKLQELTVLEGVMDDDEDLLDDDEAEDAESGDWYPEYDGRVVKGTNNMRHLLPEGFTDSVLKFEKDGESEGEKEAHLTHLSHILAIKKLLNEDPENPNLAALQPVAEANTVRSKRSVFPEAKVELVDPIVAPRVVTKEVERRKTKKYAPESSPKALHTVTRIVRNSDSENGYQRRPFIAAHFHGNTSHLSTEIHEHYKGNGLVRVAHGAAHDVWYPAPWTVASPHPRPTLTRAGHVHVHHTGVYLVYVQIYYLDSHDVISWVLHRTNAEIEGRETLLQCAQSSHSTERMDKPNSCFSASALFLKAGDRLAVRNTGGDRHSLMEPEKSFIGLVKLADADDPEPEF